MLPFACSGFLVAVRLDFLTHQERMSFQLVDRCSLQAERVSTAKVYAAKILEASMGESPNS